MTYCISAGIELTDGCTTETGRALLAGLERDTAGEPGCIRFEIRQDMENPRRFTLWEEWVDAAALEAHFEYPHTKAVIGSGATRVCYVEKLSARLGGGEG